MTKRCKKCDLDKPLEEMIKVSKTGDKYTNTCKTCESNRKKEYRKNNKKELNKREKEYRKNKSDSSKRKRKEYDKTYRDENRVKINKYFKNRKKEDPLFKLISNIRNLIGNSFRNKGVRKGSKTARILGCSFEEFKSHLEIQFESWMSWENYGRYNGQPNYGWDIDHKIPLKVAMNEDEIICLNHFTNLQPLCSYKNRDIKKDNL